MISKMHICPNKNAGVKNSADIVALEDVSVNEEGSKNVHLKRRLASIFVYLSGLLDRGSVFPSFTIIETVLTVTFLQKKLK